MKSLFTLFLAIGTFSAFGQYNDYVPQIPIDALYRNMQYKQQLYDQRRAQIQERVNYTYELMQKLSSADYRGFEKVFDESIEIIGRYDLTDTNIFYQAINWFNKFDRDIKNSIP